MFAIGLRTGRLGPTGGVIIGIGFGAVTGCNGTRYIGLVTVLDGSLAVGFGLETATGLLAGDGIVARVGFTTGAEGAGKRLKQPQGISM